MREFELLGQIYKANTELPAMVTIPPGDDMGAVEIGGQMVLVTVDQLADGVHVDASRQPMALIGRKAITRNLSDVAAMAAKPVGAVAAAALPRSMSDADVNTLCKAMQDTAAAYDCPLFGGDVTIWDRPLMVTVTALAQPAGQAPVLRRGAMAGDVIFVSGMLGGSLEQVGEQAAHHLAFEPRIELALALAADDQTRPHCMLDLSDGLGQDVGHLARAAGLVAELDVDRLPISDAAKQAASASGQPGWRHAVGDGEDYELCFTIDAARARRMPATVCGVRITPVGRMMAASSDASGECGDVRVRFMDGRVEPLNHAGWEHGR